MRVSTRRIRSERHLGLAVRVEIAWDKAGCFGTAVSVAQGKFAGFCGPLAQGQSMVWSFKGDRPVNLNIHHQECNQVVFPAQQDAAVDSQGKLDVSLSQGRCWMGANKANTLVRLQPLLQK